MCLGGSRPSPPPAPTPPPLPPATPPPAPAPEAPKPTQDLQANKTLSSIADLYVVSAA